MRTTVERVAATSIIAIALTVVSLPALAHVDLQPAEVPAESGTTLSFRIGHGCDGTPTTSVAIQIPAGVASVQPFPKAGWDVDIEYGTLPEPIPTGDQPIEEGVTVVTWSGGSLDDAHTDTFQIRATVYGEPGSQIFFPVVQSCQTGEHAWIELPADGQDSHSLDSPAPGITLTESTDDGHGHGAEAATDEHAEAGTADTIGSIDAEAANAPETGQTDTLTIVALVVGALGLIAGVTALATLRSRR